MNTPDFGDIQDFILQIHLQLFNFRDVKSVIPRGLLELVLTKFFLKVSEAASYHTFYENEKYGAGFSSEPIFIYSCEEAEITWLIF